MSNTLSRRDLLRFTGTTMLAAPFISLSSRTVNAADPIQALLIRYPATEFYANAMSKVPGVELSTQMMPSDKLQELININFSSKSSNFDIIASNDTNLVNYVRNDWLMPMDELWAKYKDEYALDGIDQSFLKGCMVDGKLYQVPNEFNTHLLFYRKDLYEKAGLKPAETIEEFMKNAQALKASGLAAGTTMMCRVGDQCASEMNYYLNVLGDGWFDKDWKPSVASDKGVKSVEFMREMGKLAQRGFLSAGGDEGSLALYQGFAAMGNMWATRAAAVDDPKKSRFVGQFGFAAPAQGGQRMSISGYAISKFTKKDPDMLFRVILESAKLDVQRANTANVVPPRPDLLKDEELNNKYPYLQAAAKAAPIGKFFPAMPYFYPVAEIVTRRLAQVMTDEMKAKEAMATATNEAEQLLTSNGFYNKG